MSIKSHKGTNMKYTLRVIIFSIFISSGNAHAWGEDKFCMVGDLRSGKCSKGDLLYVPSPIFALRFCDFDKNIIPFSKGDASDIKAVAICYYLGSERKRK